MAGGPDWYGFTGFVQGGNYFIGSGLTHVEQTGQYSSESAALAYAKKTWGGQTTYKFLGVEDSAVSEAEDLLSSSGRGTVLVSGPYATQAEAGNFVQTEQAGAGATTENTNSTDTQGPSLGSWETALRNLLGDLGDKNTWIRVAKVAAGGVLLIIGLAQLTGTGKVIEDVAGKVPVVPV